MRWRLPRQSNAAGRHEIIDGQRCRGPPNPIRHSGTSISASCGVRGSRVMATMMRALSPGGTLDEEQDVVVEGGEEFDAEMDLQRRIARVAGG